MKALIVPFVMFCVGCVSDRPQEPELLPATKRVTIASAGHSSIYIDRVPRVYGSQGVPLVTSNPCESTTRFNTDYAEIKAGEEFAWSWSGEVFDADCNARRLEDDRVSVTFCYAEYPWNLDKPARHVCENFDVVVASDATERREISFDAHLTDFAKIDVTNTTEMPLVFDPQRPDDWLTAKVGGFELGEMRLARNSPTQILPGETETIYVRFNDRSDPNSIVCGIDLRLPELTLEVCASEMCKEVLAQSGSSEIVF